MPPLDFRIRKEELSNPIYPWNNKNFSKKEKTIDILNIAPPLSARYKFQLKAYNNSRNCWVLKA